MLLNECDQALSEGVKYRLTDLMTQIKGMQPKKELNWKLIAI